MAYGMTFNTNTGKTFSMDQVQPGVFLGTVNLTDSTHLKYPNLNGEADIYAELINRVYTRSGNGQVSSIVRYSYTRPAKGELKITFNNANVASFTARFSIFARFS